ncbi:hypothetical protein [Vibrio sonorensis]|uniref:hypothetical protein n=1 Tax=Vibrio sonorensis TaxID=1004316 RepID=UPI0008D9C12F|nr:hypothetical protein [Vibrio sonorensis]
MQTFISLEDIAKIIDDPEVPQAFLLPYRSTDNRKAVVWRAPTGTDLRKIVENTGKSWSELALACGLNTGNLKKWMKYTGEKQNNVHPIPYLAFKEICLIALKKISDS